jgi:hypothetical protein
VTELRGEGKSQRRMTAVHVIDVLFLSGDDMRRLHFMERQKQAALFLKVMNKPSRTDLVRMRMKSVFKLEVTFVNENVCCSLAHFFALFMYVYCVQYGTGTVLNIFSFLTETVRFFFH